MCRGRKTYMAKKGHIKRLLPGSNTPVGFYSYFDYIIDAREARKIYYFKGGPGVGKSYMMKKIAYEIINRGVDVEFHHCAADPESLDAIVIPSIGVAIIDGTSPHLLDPKYPSITGCIFNLGEFLNEKGLQKFKGEIMQLMEDNKNTYTRAYKYLAAARLIHDDIEWINGYCMDFYGANRETNKLIEKYLYNIRDRKRPGRSRHLFGSSYTLKGRVDHGESFIGIVEGIIYIKGDEGTGRSRLLEKLLYTALNKGYEVEVYHEPLVPEKIESIIIPEINLAFTTNNKFSNKKTVNLNAYIDRDRLKKYEEELKYSRDLFNNLLREVYISLAKTSSIHNKIEELYSPNIFYEGLNRLRADILDEILAMIEGKKFSNK